MIVEREGYHARIFERRLSDPVCLLSFNLQTLTCHWDTNGGKTNYTKFCVILLGKFDT
jgi:hypothetical protein